ncbi:hypothetical protein LXL04_028249 [Taraxacum kok-saghyz]
MMMMAITEALICTKDWIFGDDNYNPDDWVNEIVSLDINEEPSTVKSSTSTSAVDLKNWYSLFVFIRVVFVYDRHELKFVSCSCRVRVWPVSCSCLIPQTRIEIRVVFVFAKFVSCKFVSDTDTRHDDTNCQPAAASIVSAVSKKTFSPDFNDVATEFKQTQIRNDFFWK